jgi:hypothetical protein
MNEELSLLLRSKFAVSFKALRHLEMSVVFRSVVINTLSSHGVILGSSRHAFHLWLLGKHFEYWQWHEQTLQRFYMVFSPFIHANTLITKKKEPSNATKSFLITYTGNLFTACFGEKVTCCKQISLTHNKEPLIAVDGFFIFVIITTKIWTEFKEIPWYCL